MRGNGRKWVLLGALSALLVLTLVCLTVFRGRTTKDGQKITAEIVIRQAATAQEVEDRQETEQICSVNGWEIVLPKLSQEDRALLEEAEYEGKMWYREPEDPSGYRLTCIDNPRGEAHWLLQRRNETGTLLTARIDGYSVWRYLVVSDGVITYGTEDYPLNTEITPETRRKAHLTKFTRDLELLWTLTLENGQLNEEVCVVLEEKDGSYAVISRGILDTFCLSHVSKDGIQLDSFPTRTGNFGFWGGAVASDGYRIQFGNQIKHRFAEIAWADRSGNLTAFREYTRSGSTFFLKDMAVLGGELYCSGYCTPRKETPSDSRDAETGYVLDEIFSRDNWDISNEELTPMVRENYDAFLLVCDEKTGEPRRFYSVPGAQGRELIPTEDGELRWYVEAIADTYFSPSTSSFTIGGISIVYTAEITASGKLGGLARTEEVRAFRA